ncbi:MAG: TIGR03086 family metal-binding protein [Acidimicrobiales bacterium]
MTEPTASVSELIALGRDREAVNAATRDVAKRGAHMNGVEQLDEVMPLLEKLVAGISPDQLDSPTPCAKFTVTGVLEHMIGGVVHFAPTFRGAPAGTGVDFHGSLQERWGSAMVELLAAMHSPGAEDRIIAAPFGEVPADTFFRYTVFDGLLHGWDLASSTGQSYEPRDELVAEVDVFIRQLLAPEMRDGDTFAAETEAPPDASLLERLVAFSGRQLPS